MMMYKNQNSLNKISQMAKTLIRCYDTRNPFIIAQHLGISCNIVDFNKNLQAFSVKQKLSDRGTIYVSSNYTYYSRRILCAHELGHLLIHNNFVYNLFDTGIDPIREYEANYFALSLMPQIIPAEDAKRMTIEELNQYVADKLF